MTEYAILAVLLVRALGSYAWAFGLAVTYAASDEVHQLFVRGRHGSPIDVGIDAVGALIGLGLLRSKLRRWSTER
jgi:VanZ family protein